MTTGGLVLSDLVAVQRHTVRTLVLSQAVGAIGITIGIATASLLARDISGSESQAGLAQTFQVLGTAVAAYLLARLMARRGRRVGLTTGYLLGASGAVLAVLAGVLDSMVLLLVGALLLGTTSAANNSARYAATDLAPDEHKGRALSTVVWATTIGAVAGPNLTGPAGALANGLGIPELTGPFALGSLGMVLAALIVTVGLRPDPLLLAQEAAGVAAEPPRGTAWSRAVVVSRERPVLAFAVLAMACAHAAMVGIMIMTPLHMEHGHAELRVIGLVISLHVLGMFAFSPLVGLLADRTGRPAVLVEGAALLLAAMVLCAFAPEGSSWQIFAGLFLLGLGWSFATVAASTLIAQHAPIEARTDVQGAADLVMGLTAASAGGLAGVVVDAWGYTELAVCAVGLVVLVAIAGLGARATTRLAG
ncbi:MULTISPECIES: MFS transporter [unclassified Nocardioides]|uniref:MFS transporter n=1 Tax=unclassified Nocardioides TaxID=2615069 RepID=UPI0009F0B549|nr:MULTISPECIES: MFS transporter [unclassified Nocardioides]GAW49368.1 major facilitator transporter [Nocardioides sp. PD653-B2]GAW55118.1 major facilitator transporter [Nocardioides sp. PD653]